MKYVGITKAKAADGSIVRRRWYESLDAVEAFRFAYFYAGKRILHKGVYYVGICLLLFALTCCKVNITMIRKSDNKLQNEKHKTK